MNPNEIPAAYLPDHSPAFRRRGPPDWNAIRADYLAGEPASVVCERHAVSLSALRARARFDGWRRADQPGAEPEAPPTLDERARDGRPDPRVMADTALRRAARAVAEGRLAEARGWTRVARELRGKASFREA